MLTLYTNVNAIVARFYWYEVFVYEIAIRNHVDVTIKTE